MAWLTADDLKTRFGDSIGDIERYYPVAFAKLNALTCNAINIESNADATGVVGGDGVTVRLPDWYTSVSKVTTSDGKTINPDMWTFTATTSDDTISADDETKYGNTLMLADERNTGEMLTVSGHHGFATLPMELKNVIMSLMAAYQNRADGTDRIKSKSIEDVSVSQDSQSAQTPESIAMETGQPLVDKWSLCTDKYYLGELGYPSKKWNPPYYVGSEERLGGNHHVIGSVL